MSLKNLTKKNFEVINNLSDTWYLLDTGVSDGKFNMACDLFLLNSLIQGFIKFPVLRFYSWNKRTISLGFNQVIDKNLLSEDYSFVRRMTGGHAVFHGLCDEELTYSLVVRLDSGFKKLYFELGDLLVLFLAQYGLKSDFGKSHENYKSYFNCFDSKGLSDLVISDVKIVGSAQLRRNKCVLQHGSIKLDKINILCGSKITYDRAVLDLKKTFKENLNVNFLSYNLTEEDKQKINYNVDLLPSLTKEFK